MVGAGVATKPRARNNLIVLTGSIPIHTSFEIRKDDFRPIMVHGTGAASCSAAVAILISGEARSGRSVWELSGSACDPRSSSQIRPMCYRCAAPHNHIKTAQGNASGKAGSVRETTTN